MVKRKKHPDAPKAALGSYMWFCQEERPKVVEDKPDLSAKEILTELGNRWRQISEDDKKRFQEKADEDKVRYKKEEENFLLTHQSIYITEEVSSKRKRKKDPNAPKGAKSAYLFFSQDIREEVVEELQKEGDVKPTDIMKRIGARWREMSDDGKQPFVDKATEDKQRYDAEMKKYTESK
eukprot:augustus_masked-scaffold_69-processed-gene-0.59-mRNA-1 protein AED:0.05 eAED:0.07 QI:0/-1/0/1/-1/1/1/0/178